MKRCFTLRMAVGLFAALLLLGCSDKSEGNPGAPDSGDKPDPKPDPTPELTFEISSAMTFDSATITVECSDKSMTFYCAINSVNSFNLIEGEDAYINAELASMQEYADELGVSLKELLAEMLHTGTANVSVTKTLDADVDYYIYAYGLSTDGAVLSDMKKILVHTPVADPVVFEDCIFNFELLEASSSSYGVAVYPTNQAVEYYCAAITSDLFYQYGGTPDGIKQYLTELFEQEAASRHVSYGKIARDNCMHGIQVFGEYAGVESDADFVAFAVGMDSQGRCTTEVGTFDFRTLSQVQSEASVTLEYSKYYDGTELANADPATYEVARNNVFMPLTVVPDELAMTWRLYAGTKAKLSPLDDELLYFLLETKGEPDQTDMNLVCLWDEYMLIAAAQDENGLWGPLVKEEISFLKTNVSPISDIISAPQRSRVSVPVVSSVLRPVRSKFKGRQGNFVPYSETSRFIFVK